MGIVLVIQVDNRRKFGKFVRNDNLRGGARQRVNSLAYILLTILFCDLFYSVTLFLLD
jgi:hypothetical protein